MKIRALYSKLPETLTERRRPDYLQIRLPGGGYYYLPYGEILNEIDENIVELDRERKRERKR